MKKIVLHCYFIVCVLMSSPAKAADIYLDPAANLEYSKQNGYAYIFGGSIGLATSTILSIQSKETLPQVGYTGMQILSAFTMLQGSELVAYGSAYDQEQALYQMIASEVRVSGLRELEQKKLMERLKRSLKAFQRRKNSDLSFYRGITYTSLGLGMGGVAAMSTNTDKSVVYTSALISVVSLYLGIRTMIDSTWGSLSFESPPAPPPSRLSFYLVPHLSRGAEVGMQFQF